jgi:rhodanese-related sulfurtransferase
MLLVAKFVPGLNAMVSPLAGTTHMDRRQFILYDALGAFLWAGSFMALGYVFSGELERIASRVAYLGEWLVFLCAVAFAGYIGWKLHKRYDFLRKLKIARITPEELKQRIDTGENLVIVDLRHALEFDENPETIPGALHMDAADLEEACDVCSCPNEATAASLALQLRRKGITKIRPLAEGYDGWRNRGFPMRLIKDQREEQASAFPSVNLV